MKVFDDNQFTRHLSENYFSGEIPDSLKTKRILQIKSENAFKFRGKSKNAKNSIFQ